VREIGEETGCQAKIDRFAGITSYSVGGRPKVVIFFHMTTQGKCKEIPLASEMEVDALQWVTVSEAIPILSYETERLLLRTVVKD
jgi:8-oxo-dGTP pyrophosphatase MutT (NUDIX family)